VPNHPTGGPRPRLLVVEDNFTIAASLRVLLQRFGFDVVGMAGTVATALDLVASRDFDVAVLDIDLHREPVTAVALAVEQRGGSMVFLSGYGDADVLPSRLRAYPRLQKPVDPGTLAAVLRDVFQRDGATGGDRPASAGAVGCRAKDGTTSGIR